MIRFDNDLVSKHFTFLNKVCIKYRMRQNASIQNQFDNLNTWCTVAAIELEKACGKKIDASFLGATLKISNEMAERAIQAKKEYQHSRTAK